MKIRNLEDAREWLSQELGKMDYAMIPIRPKIIGKDGVITIRSVLGGTYTVLATYKDQWQDAEIDELSEKEVMSLIWKHRRAIREVAR